MPTILFVCLHRPDRSASQRFRFEQYIPYFEKNGYRCRISFLLNASSDQLFYSRGRYAMKMLIAIKSMLKRSYEIISPQADIIFVQRECIMLGTAFFEKMFARKCRLIYDFDDSLWIKQVSAGNKAIGFLKSSHKIKNIIRVADHVIAGNQYLANYALQYNPLVSVIPTTLDTSVFLNKEKVKKEKICIGWSGSVSTIPHFEIAIDAFKKLKEIFGDKIYFKILADVIYKNPSFETVSKIWTKEKEIEELQEIDIGIMPLPDTEWARGKCGFKGLLYMSLGIPAVMSPVGMNNEIINEGVNGFLAQCGEDWIIKLSRLINDPQLRITIGNKGRETVLKKYSVDANKDIYLDIFKSLA